MERLTIAEVEEIAFDLARRHMEFDEPIPDFSSRFPGILEGCLAVPFQRFFGQDPYPTLAKGEYPVLPDGQRPSISEWEQTDCHNHSFCPAL